MDSHRLVGIADAIQAKREGYGRITWGEPARLAAMSEGFCCGRCSARPGRFGREYGVDINSNEIPVIVKRAFDVRIRRARITAALCWNCEFSY